MPSFMSDDRTTANADILNLDPHNQFDIVAEKANGKINNITVSNIHHPHAAAVTNEPFDETSTSSIHDSDVSDSVPVTANGLGNITQPTSMSSISNGKPVYGGYNGRQANGGSKHDDELFINGSATTVLPDRSAPRGTDSGVNGNDAGNGHFRTSGQSYRQSEEAHGPQTPGSPIGYFPSEQRMKRADEDHSTVSQQPFSSDGQPHDSTPHQLLTPATPNGDLAPSQPTSPHRYSSPPTYQPANASSSSHLNPPQAGNTLKQRHTLEVPKASSNRHPKDGMDTAQASGRFSPTVAGGRRPSLSLARKTTRSVQSEAQRDEVVPDEDAQRWAEAYRQKRASKRKRKEEQDDDRVLVGTKVDESHANWVTAYNMLTGIRVSVSRTNAKLDRELNDSDFDAKQKSTFDIAGNELVPSAKYDFKFKDYAPWVFRHLRHLFRLDPADYLMSLTGKYILSELGSPGKSGSFFYFSRDYKYIIKTIHHAEHKFLRKILKDYYHHVKENPNTLLSQFYGLHRVKTPYGKKIHFVVMNNLFPPHRDIHTTFDLKGSTVGRDYREEDLEKNPRATLKDLNWLRRQRSLELGIQKKRLFLEQLQRDVVLMKKLQIMDYSLLIGIHDVSRGNEENLRDKTLQVFNPGGEKPAEDDPQSVLLRTPSKLENARKARELRQMIRSERPVPIGQALDKMPDELGEGKGRPGFVFNQDDGGFRATHEDNSPADEIYYLGVIDCLTHYGMIKKIEHFWKGLTSDKTQISALPPSQYGDRFYNFVEGITMSPEEAKREAELRAREAAAEEEGARPSARTSRRKSNGGIPPMPEHQPPPPPNVSSPSPEGRELVERASREAWRAEPEGYSERHLPDRTLRTAVPNDGRTSMQNEPILPVVEEQDAEYRPKTPAKDHMPAPTRAPPPTPPVKAVGQTTTAYQPSRLSKESLRHKTLPPLPNKDGTGDSGVRMVV